MSGSLNKVMLIGNLGDDVKMVNFDDGGCLGRFPIATNESYNNKQTGEKVVNTEWHNVVVKNKAAEICAKYLKKGDKIYVGVDAFKLIWSKIGRYKFLAKLLDYKVVYSLATYLYEVLAFFLYLKNRKQINE